MLFLASGEHSLEVPTALTTDRLILQTLNQQWLLLLVTSSIVFIRFN